MTEIEALERINARMEAIRTHRADSLVSEKEEVAFRRLTSDLETVTAQRAAETNGRMKRALLREHLSLLDLYYQVWIKAPQRLRLLHA